MEKESDRNALRDGLEALLLRLVLAAFAWLPARLCVGFLHLLARCAWLVLPGRRRHAELLVRQSLDLDDRAARRIVRGAFETLALNIGESILLERMLASRSLEELIRIDGSEHLDAALAAGRGVLLATAHLGAWEAMPLVLARRFRPVWTVGRPLDNPRLQLLVDRLRARQLAGTLDKEGSGLRMARLFRNGEFVGLLLDQNAGREGLMLDFLGRPALQHKVAGVMARRFDVPVVPVYMLREPGLLRFHLVIEAPLHARQDLPEEDAVREVVQGISDSLEGIVRRHPGQWLWLHDRWKRAAFVLRRAARAAAAGAAGTAPPAPAASPGAGLGPGPRQGTNEDHPSRPRPAP